MILNIWNSIAVQNIHYKLCNKLDLNVFEQDLRITDKHDKLDLSLILRNYCVM